MATTWNEIRDRLRRIEDELSAVRIAVEELTVATPPDQHVNGQPSESDKLEPYVARQSAPAPQSAPPPVDRELLREAFLAMMQGMGIEDMEPIGAEKLQEQMRQHGIRAEDNILSRGIIEMREE